jgi:thiol-disulfide isomerase/thioredoxin
MEIPVKTSSSTVGCALIPLLMLLPSPASPQNKQGTVKVDSLAVYSKMSTESDVVKTLAQGTVVRILLTVTSEEGNWCSVASQDSSSRIGYVPCSGLDRPKDIPAVDAQGGSRLQILIGTAHTPVQTSKRQTHGSEEGGVVGQTLAPLPGYSWSSYPKTLVIAIRKGCPYCDASMPFYRQLGEQEKSNVLRAHVLVVMPNDAASGSRFLSKDDVEVQGIFGQELEALNVSGTPTLLLLDSSGRIEREWVGQLSPRAEKEVMNAAAE